MPKHVVRLLALVGIGLVLALVARTLLMPASFGQFGHYRAESVVENASLRPVHVTSGRCEKCHEERYAQWSASNHKSVTCENCHGQGSGHPRSRPKLPVQKDTVHLCTLCHESTVGRPIAHPQVVLANHAQGQQCASCHNPHSPKIAADIELNGDVERGKALAVKVCAECHGADGISPNATWPNLAGLSARYLVRLTTAYQTGDQQDAAMTPLAKKLSDQNIQDVSAYYASLSCGKAPAGGPRGDVEAGRGLAKNCARCHGETGIPTIHSWPLIAGQAQGYLVNVLKAFRAGLRKDPMMATAAGSLSDADIVNLAAFYAAQACKAPN